MHRKTYWSWRFVVELLALGFIAPVSTFAQPLLEPAGVDESTAGLILVAVVLSETLPEWLDRTVSTREAGPDNDRSQHQTGGSRVG